MMIIIVLVAYVLLQWVEICVLDTNENAINPTFRSGLYLGFIAKTIISSNVHDL